MQKTQKKKKKRPKQKNKNKNGDLIFLYSKRHRGRNEAFHPSVRRVIHPVIRPIIHPNTTNITYSKGTMKPPVKPDGHSPKPELNVMAFLLFSTPELQARP